MIFQAEHREQIRAGEKTATRRQWDSDRATIGKTYRATLGGNVEQGMFTPREECDCFIRVTDVYEQPLSEMTEADADAEGGYTLAEFRETWREINGEWDSEETVWVVEFEYAGNSDPRVQEEEEQGEDSDEPELATDGGSENADYRTDDYGRMYPAELDGIDIPEQTECPACESDDGWTEQPAGYYHCLSCMTVWAGDPGDAHLIDYCGPDVETDTELVTDGGIDREAIERRRQRVDDLRPTLADRHEFDTESDPQCAVCDTHDDVDLDPGLSFDDLQYRCAEHKRLQVKFWLFPGDHPTMPSPNNLFTCDDCGDEFTFPYGVFALEGSFSTGHENQEYRCLDCTTLAWLRRFCTSTNRMAGFEAMCAAVDEGKDVDHWRRKAHESDRHEWCEVCKASYFAHFGTCPRDCLADDGDADGEEEVVTDGGVECEQGASRDIDHPCECPECGGPVTYGITEKNQSIVLCKGDCGEWSFVYSWVAENEGSE